MDPCIPGVVAMREEDEGRALWLLPGAQHLVVRPFEVLEQPRDEGLVVPLDALRADREQVVDCRGEGSEVEEVRVREASSCLAALSSARA